LRLAGGTYNIHFRTSVNKKNIHTIVLNDCCKKVIYEDQNDVEVGTI